MVQNAPYRNAKECARLQYKTQVTRKVRFFFNYVSEVESCHILLLSSMVDFVFWLKKACSM